MSISDSSGASYEPVAESVRRLAECPVCAAAVPCDSRDRHDEWHDKIKPAVSEPHVARVPTALDFPGCRRCQMWKDAGASWPRPCKQHHEGEPATPAPFPDGWPTVPSLTVTRDDRVILAAPLMDDQQSFDVGPYKVWITR